MRRNRSASGNCQRGTFQSTIAEFVALSAVKLLIPVRHSLNSGSIYPGARIGTPRMVVIVGTCNQYCEAQRVYSGVVRGFLNSGALILAHASQRLGWLSAWRVSINRRRVHRVVRGSCPTFPQLGKHLFGRIHRSASDGCQRGHVQSIFASRSAAVTASSAVSSTREHLFGCTHRSASGNCQRGTFQSTIAGFIALSAVPVRHSLNSGSIYSGAFIAVPRVVVSVGTFQSIIAGFIAFPAVPVRHSLNSGSIYSGAHIGAPRVVPAWARAINIRKVHRGSSSAFH